MSGSKIRLYGSTSGYVELAPPAVSPDAVLTLPPTFAGVGTNVVSTTKTDTFTTTSTSPTAITGASVTITPSSATSKILVFYSFPVTASTSMFLASQLTRGGTAIGGGAVEGSRLTATSRGYLNAQDYVAQFNGHFLDSPATTSATTYAIDIWVDGGTAVVGRSNSNTDNAQARHARTPLTITAIEVAA